VSRERQGIIRHWEHVLHSSEVLLDPSTNWIVKETIKDLKRLDEIEEATEAIKDREE
jgi:hypothetical protein